MILIGIQKKTAESLLLSGALILSALPGISSAAYASIAYGTGNTGGWALGDSQVQANEKALAQCNKESNSKNDCVLAVDTAVAKAESATRVGFGASRSVVEARASALKSCGDPACNLVKVWTTPGFYATALPKDKNGSFYFVYGSDNSNSVDKEAIAGCEEYNARPCEVHWSRVISGKIQASAPPAAQPVYRDAPIASNSCRPNTQALRCSSQCTNGSCTVTYDNGCKVHVNVAPKFDPFNNQWNYPAPSC